MATMSSTPSLTPARWTNERYFEAVRAGTLDGRQTSLRAGRVFLEIGTRSIWTRNGFTALLTIPEIDFAATAIEIWDYLDLK